MIHQSEEDANRMESEEVAILSRSRVRRPIRTSHLMSEGQPTNGSGNRTWLERLTQALLGEPLDREKLVEQLRDAEQHNILDAEALSMIEGVMQVSDIQVRDVMIPRAQMVVVESDCEPDEFVKTVLDSGSLAFPGGRRQPRRCRRYPSSPRICSLILPTVMAGANSVCVTT